MNARIFLVDDQALVRAGFKMLIEAQPDMEVVGEAEDGRAALEALAVTRADLVLMDVRMPGKDGLSAIREIRAHEDGKQDVPIIVVTGDNAYDIRVRARAVGANDVLIKPVTQEQLLEAIARVVPARGGPKAA